MNTHDIDIELPPEFQSGNSVPVSQATIKRERMEEILRSAIEADRQRRGEPVAWRYLTPTGWHATTDAARALAVAEHHTVEPLFTNPHPAENTDPVKSQTETWVVGTEDNRTVYIQSSDFKYDTRLYVNGDFINKDEKIMYANELAKRLNDPTR